MLIKSALRDLLSVSYSMISILRIGSLRSPPPFRLRRTSPYSGGKINRSMLSCRDMTPLLSIHSAPSKRGKGGGVSHQRGEISFARQGGWPVFLGQKPGCKGLIQNWRPIGRRTSPVQRYYIPPECESPEPVRKASADPGQNPWRPGPSGPAAPSTLAAKPRQPSGIQVSAVSVPKAHHLK